ncbi:aminotransferase class I/II-fold pyridoxal phosphate-dependent enzyme, partial [Thermodesulfovibrionales bacterium]|nr:aminotransferase class I/II-fold pyridoxal phosphate-dependent enzyme [Thermodesulfovibrionales bacterium]
MPINRIHGGNIRVHLEGKTSQGEEIIDFSVNVNPLGMSSSARKTLKENIDILIHYPEPDSRQLKESLASFHSVGYDNLLIGNGSIELIHLIPRALKAKKVLIVAPSFSEYEFAVNSSGAKPIFVTAKEEEDFKLNSLAIMQFIPEVDVVFLGNPN